MSALQKRANFQVAGRTDLALPPRLPTPPRTTPKVGQILMDLGALSADDALRAAALRQREDLLIGEILLAHNMVSERALYQALALQFDCEEADLLAQPPCPHLIDALGLDLCLQHGLLPWRRVGAALVVVTSEPQKFAELRNQLPAPFNEAHMAVAPPAAITRALTRARPAALALRAETRVQAELSCRDWRPQRAMGFISLVLACLILFAAIAPAMALTALCLLGIMTLALNSGLKIAAALALSRAPKASPPNTRAPQTKGIRKLPRVSVLVPLFRETSIAGRLVERLSRLNYPAELLDICLVVEADDWPTQWALQQARIPAHMRRIHVPKGALKTKPRAMNFALDFCKGSLIGVWDAEDAPHPDQIFDMVRAFEAAPPDVVCLQGVLDFYNARTNWLSRCFTIEYATWFRVLLPGLARMGMVVPLGGTTLFFRRQALEEINAWDAHNVTEDADLGIRLARAGYRTELIETVTREEANCRLWPWVRQRSRWLKGFIVTWAVHMRAPRQLYRDLGARGFWGVQVLFVGTILHFLLTPFLLSLWALPLGLPHPAADVIGPAGLIMLGMGFAAAELGTLTINAFATRKKSHRWLWKWVPTLHFYFPLGSLAVTKAIWELLVNPFYWDKTEHGVRPKTRAQRS